MWKCVKLMDIYVHLYGNLSHYMNSSDIFTKTEINPFDNVIMHMCACMCVHTHTQEDVKFTKCIR